MLFSAQAESDLLGEFKQLVGNLFAGFEESEITRLRSAIAVRRKAHRNAADLEQRLIVLVTRKIQRELAT